MRPVHISSTGGYLPGDPVTNDDLERLVGPLPPEIAEGLQTVCRHWMIDPATGEHRETNSGMAAKAVRQALDRAGMAPADVELLVVSTASPEYPLPPMVTLLQEKLGLTRCATLELRSGCAGAVEALDLATLHLGVGRFDNAVVIGSEAISPLLAPLFVGKGASQTRLRDRMAPYTFGDGAGAIVLQAAGDGAAGGVVGSAFASIGGDRRAGMQVEGAGTHAPVHELLRRKRLIEIKVDVVEAGRFTPHVIAQSLTAVLARCELRAEDVDVCVLPEGNAGYVREEMEAAGLLTEEWLAIEGKVVENLATVGATGSAAVPLALDDAWVGGRVVPGDTVLLLAIETSKWKYAGTAVRWTAPTPRRAQSTAA